MFGGQGRRQCACHAGAKQCTTQRCKCRKAGVLCTSCRHSSWLEKPGWTGRTFPSGAPLIPFPGWDPGTQYITKMDPFYFSWTVFSNCNSCIGGFRPFDTLGDPFPRGPPRPSTLHLGNHVSSPAICQGQVSRNRSVVGTCWNCCTVSHFVHLHYWCKFRKGGLLCTSQCHLLMTCQQIKKALILSLSVFFSSENGKNKVVATRECKHSRTTKSLQKVPIVPLAFHAMPRQRLYSDDFGHITIFSWPLPGITWNA